MADQFVALYHEFPSGKDSPSHVDLMLQRGDTLATWRFDDFPLVPTQIVAVALADHRLAYLDYEGPVSGGRGSVRRLDRGELRWLSWSPENFSCELAGGRLACRLIGERKHDHGWWFRFQPPRS